MKRSNEVRTKLQQISDDLQQKPQLKLPDIDLLKNQLDRCLTDLRTIQSESSILDRLMEESSTTITDSTTNRTLFFTVESRSIQNLVDTVQNKVSLVVQIIWCVSFKCRKENETLWSSNKIFEHHFLFFPLENKHYRLRNIKFEQKIFCFIRNIN